MNQEQYNKVINQYKSLFEEVDRLQNSITDELTKGLSKKLFLKIKTDLMINRDRIECIKNLDNNIKEARKQ